MFANKNKLKILILLSLTGLISLSIFLYYDYEKNHIYKVFVKSGLHYKNELTSLINDNYVLDQLNNTLRDSYVTTYEQHNKTIAFKNDKQNEIYEIDYSSNTVPLILKAFITNDDIIIGSDSLTYLIMSNDIFNKEIAETSDNPLVIKTASLNLNYNSLNDARSIPFKKYSNISKELYKTLNTLMEVTEYQISDDTIYIGESLQKCEKIELNTTFTNFLTWVRDDISPYINYDIVTPINSLLNSSDFYDGMIYTDLYVYKGVIVAININLIPDDGENLSTLAYYISATGSDYLLNDITYEYYYFDKLMIAFNLKGNHINTDIVTSEFKLNIGNLISPTFEIIWETKKDMDNLSISNNNLSIETTLAKNGQTIRFDLPFANIYVRPLDQPIVIPQAKRVTELLNTKLFKLIKNSLKL